MTQAAPAPTLQHGSALDVPDTGRVQLALNVDDLEQSIAFYSRLFNVEPAKVRPGYANFAVASPPLKLVLLENPGKGGSLNHLGVEVSTSERVHAEIDRLSTAGLITSEEMNSTCCYATQDKVWVQGPGEEGWEFYTVLADSETFGTDLGPVVTNDSGPDVCCGGNVNERETGKSACC
ncbi:MAG TPA: ArsI/CadI family heavy metal resistance metalloenzyme [Actinomycetes bacterium]|nr:ArsI/CadI family heavy metal resistance metalloenzyme [Actinomycetes bacterium]